MEGAGKKLASRIRFFRSVELRGGNEINRNELALHTTGEWLGRWVVLRSFPEWPNLVSASAHGTRNLGQMGNVQNAGCALNLPTFPCPSFTNIAILLLSLDLNVVAALLPLRCT